MDPDSLLFHALLGLITGLIAKSKGRNAIGWGVFGFIIPLIPVVAVILVANLKDPEVRARREAYAQDKAKQRAGRRAEWEAERAAQMAPDPDEQPLPRSWSQALPGNAAQPAAAQIGRADGWGSQAGQAADSTGLPPRLPADDPTPLGEETAWYFEENGRARGPEPESAVRKQLVQGRLAPDTLVWAAGMDEWAPADTRREFLA